MTSTKSDARVFRKSASVEPVAEPVDKKPPVKRSKPSDTKAAPKPKRRS